MKRNSFSLLSLLVGALSFAACSGPPGGWTGGGGGGGGTGTTTVSFTMVADTFPATPSLMSYTVQINGITLTPTTGTPVTLTPSPSPTIDLVRLQSDSAYLGTLTSVPAGSYTVTVSISGVGITFFNDSGSAITVGGGVSCANLAVCAEPLSASGSPLISSFTFTANAGGTQGIGLDFNLNSSLTLAGGALSGNFGSSVLSAFALPRTGSNLSASQLDLIEDFTGVVSLGQANNVTITSPTRGAITASSTSTTGYDPDPTGTLCNNAPTSLSDCVASNQLASMDAVLNADGTFSVLEIEPLDASVQDIVEGTVLGSTDASHFAIVVTDKLPAANGSLIGSLRLGDPLNVNITNIPNTFYVDTKGLDVQTASPAAYSTFFGQSSTSAIFPGQSIAIHVTAFTAQNGTTPASATADTVTLRFSRLTAGVQPLTSSTFTIGGIPSSFVEFAPGSTFLVQAFINAPRSTNVEGVTDLSSLSSTKPVAIRALFFENSGFSLQPSFFAAKVRQH